MSLALYDQAFLKKLKAIAEKTSIHVYSVEETRRLFEVIADETNDKPLTLPIICLHRGSGYTIAETGNNPRSINALRVVSTDAGSIVLNHMQISIDYQIDVYARKFEEADAIMRELVFILTNTPNVIITIPYDGINYLHKSALNISKTIRDNSSVAERLISGQFSRLTLDCNIPDAHLFDTRKSNYLTLDPIGDLHIISPDTSDVVERLDLANKEEIII